MATTFNPADLYPDGRTTLSNGDLTVTGHFFADGSARTIFSASSGKYYYEATCGSTGTSNYQRGVAIGISTTRLDYGLGSPDTTSANVFQGDANVYVQGSSAGTGTSYGVNSVVCVALDLDNNLIWYRTGAGNWNGSSSNNPATGVGGKSISGMSKPIYVMCFLTQGGDPVTFNFGDSAFTQTAPVGFGNFGTAGPTNYTMAADLGTVTAAGQNATLTYAPVLPVIPPLFVGRSRLLRRPWLRAMVSMPVPAPPATAYTMAADLGTLTLAGQPTVLLPARAMPAGLGTLTPAGQPAVLRSGRKLTADLGTLTLSGQPATLTYSRRISMAAGLGVLTPAGQATNLVYSGAGSKTMLGGLGTITLAGQPVTVRYARRMPGGLGTLTLAGQPVTLVYSRKIKMAADLGTITLSGQPAILRYAHRMAAGLGTLTLSGQPVTLTYSRKLKMAAGLGTLTLDGQNVTLTKASSSAKVIAAGLGTITIGGQPVTLRYAHKTAAGLGTITLGGQPAGLRRAKNLNALVGNIILTGQAAGLTYTHTANIRMAAGPGTLVLAGQSVGLPRVSSRAGQPGVLNFGRRVTINRW